MDDPDIKKSIRDWLRDRLAAEQRGTRSRLARELKLDRSAITHMIAGSRDISASELVIIRRFFGVKDEQPGELKPSAITHGVPVVGRIGENIWSRASTALGKEVLDVVPAGDADDLSMQSAFTLEETTKDGDYRRGDRVYTVPFASARAHPLVGDVVVVESEKDGFKRFTLRKAVQRGTAVVLEPMFAQPDPATTVDRETVVELVIGFFRPQRRR